MARRQQSQTMGSGLSREDAFGLLYAGASGHATCFIVFTRRNFGQQAFAVKAPIALAIMLLYWAFAPCPEMRFFVAAWFVLLCFHRLVTLIKRLRGWEAHSRLAGESWMLQAIIRPRPSDFVAKVVCEPVLAVIVGALLYQFSEMLGLFVMAGSVSLVAQRLIERGIENAGIQAMLDQEIEMRARMARYRGRP